MSIKLSETEYRKHLDEMASERLQDLLIVNEVDSTNAYLQRFGDPELGKVTVCIAEQQSAGRGRQGKVWESIFGGSLLLSLSWTFSDIPKDFSALSLVVGVELRETLGELGFEGITLKWPNDILVDEAKLGGILLEVAQRNSHIQLVCGIGLNVLGGLDNSKIEHKVISLEEILLPEKQHVNSFSRNLIAAKLTSRLIEVFNVYPRVGFSPWRARWQEAHAYIGQQVQVTGPNILIKGIALGVDEVGAFLVQTDEKIERFISNDISIRKIFR